MYCFLSSSTHTRQRWRQLLAASVAPLRHLTGPIAAMGVEENGVPVGEKGVGEKGVGEKVVGENRVGEKGVDKCR